MFPSPKVYSDPSAIFIFHCPPRVQKGLSPRGASKILINISGSVAHSPFVQAVFSAHFQCLVPSHSVTSFHSQRLMALPLLSILKRSAEPPGKLICQVHLQVLASGLGSPGYCPWASIDICQSPPVMFQPKPKGPDWRTCQYFLSVLTNFIS